MTKRAQASLHWSFFNLFSSFIIHFSTYPCICAVHVLRSGINTFFPNAHAKGFFQRAVNIFFPASMISSVLSVCWSSGGGLLFSRRWTANGWELSAQSSKVSTWSKESITERFWSLLDTASMYYACGLSMHFRVQCAHARKIIRKWYYNILYTISYQESPGRSLAIICSSLLNLS